MVEPIAERSQAAVAAGSGTPTVTPESRPRRLREAVASSVPGLGALDDEVVI
jgi:hypothetical protein